MKLNTKWKKVAISHSVDRYVIDVSKYELPYYEVKYYGHSGDTHEVWFVVPGDSLGIKKDLKELIDDSNKYAPGPYHDHLKAICEDSKKRGLPTEIEEIFNCLHCGLPMPEGTLFDSLVECPHCGKSFDLHA